MNIRQVTEEKESKYLSDYACKSKLTKGRKEPEEKCQVRTDFQRDRDRIIHSKAFRRLKHKTQVFIAPEGDHYRTRLTHTLEVSQIARTIGRALGLNEDLIEAIALGHDLGHTPFGHTGERALNRLNPNGFDHRNQSIRVVDYLEYSKGKHRKGLNLTFEVRDGIMNHSGKINPTTLEGEVVRLSDRIGYINHDIDDSIRANILREEDLPKEALDVLGKTHASRINNMILNIIENSLGKKCVKMSKEFVASTDLLRSYMFENIYIDSEGKKEESKAEYIIKEIYEYYMQNPKSIPTDHLMIYDIDESLDDIVTDYIAGMTDRYVINIYNEIFIPKPWEKY